jgi:hypothetical protein
LNLDCQNRRPDSYFLDFAACRLFQPGFILHPTVAIQLIPCRRPKCCDSRLAMPDVRVLLGGVEVYHSMRMSSPRVVRGPRQLSGSTLDGASHPAVMIVIGRQVGLFMTFKTNQAKRRLAHCATDAQASTASRDRALVPDLFGCKIPRHSRAERIMFCIRGTAYAYGLQMEISSGQYRE